MKLFSKLNQSVATRTTVIVLVLITAIMLTAGFWQMHKVRSVVIEETQRLANRSMDDAIEIIENRISTIETSVKTAASFGNMFATHKVLADKLLFSLIESNKNIAAVTLLYAPDYFPEEGRYYAPTVVRDPVTQELTTDEIGGPENDFCYIETDSNWVYSNKLDGAYWCLPYLDSMSTKRPMVSFSVPLHDENGSTYAVLCADIDLNWVEKIVHDAKPYDYSEVIVMSRDSQFICHPDTNFIQSINFVSKAEEFDDSALLKLTHRMLQGERGIDTIERQFSLKNHSLPSTTIVFYAPIKSVQWSLSFTFPESQIMAGPNALRRDMIIFLFTMLLTIAVILHFVIRAQLWPMKQLADNTYQIAKGNFSVPLPVIYTHDEIRHLRDSFEQMQESLGHYVEELQKTISSKVSIESELRVASKIQMQMLPKTYPPYPKRDDIDIFGSLTPAKQVGGDLFDFYIRDEKLFFCIGDVSGKGAPAALVMAVTMTLFRTVSAHENQPAKIMSEINRIISEKNEQNMFVTLLIGILDLPSGRLRYCNAGHEAPILITSPHTPSSDTLASTNTIPNDSDIPIGIMPEWKFKLHESVINPNTTIFLYTDGLTEAENLKHEQYGRERMFNAIEEALTGKNLFAQSLVEKLVSDVHQFVGNAEQSDDLTILSIKYTREQLSEQFCKSIRLTNDVQQVSILSEFVHNVCESLAFDASTMMQINLAIEEAVVNVMNYAYPQETIGNIDIQAQANQKRLKFTITDSGFPFDPTIKKEADITLSAEERPIGGLGILLMREAMSSINYERSDGKNILTLRKNLN